MIRVLVVFLLILLFALISYVLRKKLKKKAFGLFIVLCVCLFIGILLYEKAISSENSRQDALLLEFSSQKSLKCGEFNVSKENFNYDLSTKSFISKNKGVKAQIIAISECDLAK